MSLLVSQHGSDGVMVLSDTLGSLVGGPRVNMPFTFGLKVHDLPHIETITGAVGAGCIMEPWAEYARSYTLARDAEELSLEAPEVLRSLSQRAGLEGKAPPTDVMIWGWSEPAETFVGYQFESEKGFERVERVAGAIGVRPLMNNGGGPIGSWEDLMATIGQLKAEDAERCAQGVKSIRIGGHLVEHRMYLNAETRRPEITTRRLMTFDDYARDLALAERGGAGSAALALHMLREGGDIMNAQSFLVPVGLEARRRTKAGG